MLKQKLRQNRFAVP